MRPRGTTLIQRSGPHVRLAVELPPTKMDVVYHGRAGMIEIKDAKVPEMVMIAEYDAGRHAMGEHRFFVPKNGELYAWPGGNVWEQGRVCWGGNTQPNDPVEAYTTFFGSPFNRDLVQLPAPTPEELAPLRPEDVFPFHPSARGHRRFEPRMAVRFYDEIERAVELLRSHWRDGRRLERAYMRCQQRLEVLLRLHRDERNHSKRPKIYDQIDRMHVMIARMDGALRFIRGLAVIPLRLTEDAYYTLLDVANGTRSHSPRRWVREIADFLSELNYTREGASNREVLFSAVWGSCYVHSRLARMLPHWVKPIDLIIHVFRSHRSTETQSDEHVRLKWEAWKIKQLWLNGTWPDAVRGRSQPISWLKKAKPLPDIIDWLWEGQVQSSTDMELEITRHEEEMQPLLRLIVQRLVAKPKWQEAMKAEREALDQVIASHQRKADAFYLYCGACNTTDVRPYALYRRRIVSRCNQHNSDVMTGMIHSLSQPLKANLIILGWRDGNRHMAWCDNAVYAGTENDEGTISWARVPAKTKRSRSKKYQKKEA